MKERLLSANEWLKRNRNWGCPQHGFHIANSLVKYSGYCKHCDRFWKFVRHIEMKGIPYYWYYFNPETRQVIGEIFSGKQNGRGKDLQNRKSRHSNSDNKGRQSN